MEGGVGEEEVAPHPRVQGEGDGQNCQALHGGFEEPGEVERVEAKQVYISKNLLN